MTRRGPAGLLVTVSRAGKLGPDAALSSRVVTFPEAVALAEVLADRDWRRHVATVPARQS